MNRNELKIVSGGQTGVDQGALAAAYHVWRSTDEADAEKRLDGFFRIAMELTSDFASMLMLDAMEGTEFIDKNAACERLFNHRSYKAWSEKHGAALRKHIKM